MGYCGARQGARGVAPPSVVGGGRNRGLMIVWVCVVGGLRVRVWRACAYLFGMGYTRDARRTLKLLLLLLQRSVA